MISRMRSPALMALALGLSLALACSDPTPPPQPASFSRPTDVDFVCVRNQRLVELKECDTDPSDADQTPVLHAVVTQSARGEVAAVNLETARILDNRREVPGYTFVPAGELPIAVVVPKLKPAHTYVANHGSRDIHVLRTDIVVSLQTGNATEQIVSLGVEADGGAAGGTPSDMILTPEEDALIVALPDLGQIVRLPLLETGLIDEAGITTLDLPATVPAAPTPVVVDESYQMLCDYDRAPVPTPPVRAPAPVSTPRPVKLAIDASCDSEDDACLPRLLIADEGLPLLHVIDLAALASGGSAVLAPIATGARTRDVVVTPRVPKLSYEAPLSRPEPTEAPDGETPAQAAAREADYEAQVSAYEADEARREAEQAESTYYIYAIDADDGSVIALENDQVLAVNHDPDTRSDRLPIEGRDRAATPNAIALEILSPRFDRRDDFDQHVRANRSSQLSSDDPLTCTDLNHEELSPRRLRGVFLAAAMGDGTVRVIDVYDMELRECRTCPADVSAPVLVRHHPRLAINFAEPLVENREVLQPVASALYLVDSIVFPLRANGTTATPDAPPLECIACEDGLGQAFPDPEDQDLGELADSDGGVSPDAGMEGEDQRCTKERSALVCATSDPWVSPPEELNLVFEATIPSTQGGDGRFVLPEDADNQTGAIELVGNVAFCEAGVLGNVDIPAARDDAACDVGTPAALGDQLVIRSAPLSSARLLEIHADESADDKAEIIRKCDLLRGDLAVEKPPLVAFEVLAAFADRVAISPGLITPSMNKFREANSYLDVLMCFGTGPFAFDVRTRGSFAVNRTRVGFDHHVIPDNNGRCVIDPAGSALKTGRAWPGCAFSNERLTLKLGTLRNDDGDLVNPPPGVLLNVSVSSTGGVIAFDARQISRNVSAIVPSRLRYSDTNRELYLVDTGLGGMIPIGLDPMPASPVSAFY